LPYQCGRDVDAETVVDHLPSAELEADLINALDGHDVTQEENGLFIEVPRRSIACSDSHTKPSDPDIATLHYDVVRNEINSNA
jgi:hypothetical protein